jgi:polar amino acid transport system substrate-binding protein
VQLIATGSVVAATLAQKNPGKVEKKLVMRDSPAHIGVRRGEPDVVAWLNVFIYYHRKPGGELDALARKWFGEPLPIDPTL